MSDHDVEGFNHDIKKHVVPTWSNRPAWVLLAQRSSWHAGYMYRHVINSLLSRHSYAIIPPFRPASPPLSIFPLLPRCFFRAIIP
eukprot:763089-Hanusia_phi.AAC.9